MIGLGLAVLVAIAWDVWAEVDHRVKITTAVRSSTAAKTVVLVVGVLLLVHLYVAQVQDPITYICGSGNYYTGASNYVDLILAGIVIHFTPSPGDAY